MFSKELETAIGQCYKDARQLRHAYMTIEELLLALLGMEDVRAAVEALGGDLAILKSELIKCITENQEILAPTDESDTQPTLGFQRVLQRAVYHAQSSGKKVVTGLGTLVAVFGEKDSFAMQALTSQDIGRLDVLNYISSGTVPQPPPTPKETIDKIQASYPVSPIDAVVVPALHVFISYSHSDSACLDRLLIHLRPLERLSKLVCWSDRRIRPGGKWRDEIAENVEHAAVAVLLVSADFLASECIVNYELPPLLIKAEAKGARIIPIIVKPCGFLRDDALNGFQCANDPRAPLLGLSAIDQEHLYERVASEIYDELKARSRQLK